MSRPYALPVGPTRLAESNTSMPPPDPRSRTVWPGSSRINAVGLPQPSDAATAPSGRSPVSAVDYRFDVIGSSAPQHPAFAGASVTDAAIAPYLSSTACLNVGSVMSPPLRSLYLPSRILMKHHRDAA